jgi:hypothetical protein
VHRDLGCRWVGSGSRTLFVGWHTGRSMLCRGDSPPWRRQCYPRGKG